MRLRTASLFFGFLGFLGGVELSAHILQSLLQLSLLLQSQLLSTLPSSSSLHYVWFAGLLAQTGHHVSLQLAQCGRFEGFEVDLDLLWVCVAQ